MNTLLGKLSGQMFTTTEYSYKGNTYRIIGCQEEIQEEELEMYTNRPRWTLNPTQRRYNFLWGLYVDRVIGSWRRIQFVMYALVCLLFLLFIAYVVSIILPEVGDIVSISLMTVLLSLLLLLFLLAASVIIIKEKLLFQTEKYSIIEKDTYLRVIPHESSLITLKDGDKTTHWLY